jgi:hypothetical protein
MSLNCKNGRMELDPAEPILWVLAEMRTGLSRSVPHLCNDLSAH